MALTTGQMNFVTRVQNVARVVKDQYGELVMLNALWYGAEANYDSEIDNAALAEIESFEGITANDLNEFLYIVGNLKGLVEGRLEQIAALTK